MMKIVISFICYTVVVLAVPGYPNYYTLAVDLTAAVIALVLSHLVRRYFHSKPIHDRNVISLNIELLTHVCDVITVKVCIMSVLMNGFHDWSQHLLDKYPDLFVPFASNVLRKAEQ